MKKFLINTRIDTIDIAASLTLLSPQRRDHVLAIKSDAQRRQSIAAYLLLCELLQIPHPEFALTPHGKPYITGSNTHFSLSHCAGAAAAVIATTPVGIDIEPATRRISDALVRHTMNDDEIARIQTAEDPAKAFITLWTKKEALLKMTGEGLQAGLRDALQNHPQTTFTTIEKQGFICTICQKSPQT